MVGDVQVACLGEAMLEVSGQLGGAARLSFGGDTLNTSVYLARLGAQVAFVSALGTDPYSAELKRVWADEGVGVDLILTHPTRLPGLYAIRTDEAGERTFHYWRNESAARAFFDLPGAGQLIGRLGRVTMLYLSGISLSIFNPEGREALIELAATVRRNGGRVAFDPNYRPRGWLDQHEARRWIGALAAHVDIALPTFEDEAALWGDAVPEASIARWRQAGATEIVAKCGAEGAEVFSGTSSRRIAVPRRVSPRDTTGAGDSFNAGYLAARLAGLGPDQAALSGHLLAAEVIQHAGAIIPRAAMPVGLLSDLAQ